MAFADDYVDVAERRRQFYELYPEGSLDGDHELVTLADGTQGWVVVAVAKRAPDDPSPGKGRAWEPLPGKTNFTRGSELQNAETSAWGRAMLAVPGIESKHVASADEVRNRQSEKKPPKKADAASRARIDAAKAEAADAGIQDWVKDQGFPWPWTDEVCAAIEAKAREGTEPF